MAEGPTEEYIKLRTLIESIGNKELECREFLKHAKEMLVRDSVRQFVYLEKERRGTSGDSDYILSCEVCDETRVISVKAYVWELKAPQCFLFEKDTESRLRPTKELIQAENQLLHYVHENRGSEEFRSEFGVTHSDNVLFGGIIIGCHKTRVRGDYTEERKNKLFEKVLMIRKKFFYDPLQIRIILWDNILDLLHPSPTPEAKSIDLGELQPQMLDPKKIDVASSP